MRLFRLRSLASKTDTDRVVDLVNSGKFWCSSFAEFNDTMEGVFRTNSICDLNHLTSEKNKFKVCSFTDVYGIKNPTLWGYYGGSFRGVALEISDNNPSIRKIEYTRDIPSVPDTSDETLLKVLTTKLMPWKHEREYSFIKKNEEKLNEIEKIKSIHCFIPYDNVDNNNQIQEHSSTIQTYLSNLQRLQSEIDESVPIFVASFDEARNKIKLTNKPLRQQGV